MAQLTPSHAARRRPASVWIAAVAFGVVVAFQAGLAYFFARDGDLGWWRFAFAVAAFVLLLVGLVRGRRLAWLWGRYLALVLGVVLLASLAAGYARHELALEVGLLALFGMAVPLFVAGLALGRPSAHAWFDLVCPSCAVPTSHGADFLFRKARCRRCGTEW
jgi:peptidoglycan/LPS O-acetylase OafA/YrhL